MTTRDREEFVALMVSELREHRWTEVLELARNLMRWARTHGNYQENRCNRDVTEAEEKREERLEERIAEACKPFGITPVFSGDPRGATVKLKVPSGLTNDWGSTGICVPQ